MALNSLCKQKIQKKAENTEKNIYFMVFWLVFDGK